MKRPQTRLRLKADMYMLRRKAGISQDEIADVLGITPQTIRNYESGKFFPDLQTAIEIAHYLGVQINDIWEHDGLSQFIRADQFEGTGKL
jgi:putative transcriptional regulator